MTLVLWSGGCDSTLALYQAATKAMDEEKDKRSVRALTVCHNLVPAQQEQRAARTQLMRRFKARGLWNIKNYEVKIHVPQKTPIRQSGTPQPVFWVSSAMPFLEEKEDLHVGWIRTDDVWHHKNAIWEMFYSIARLLCKEGRLIYPLEWWRKSEVISRLKKEKLYDCCWWCEEPTNTGKQCGKCIPCRTHKTALYELDDGKKPKRKKARRKK